MDDPLGEALAGFDAALNWLRGALAADPMLLEAVFANTAEWCSLLTYKLVPHLAGQGCLVAAVTGGTNTGKSTVFNLLLGVAASPVVTTAAATRHPLMAGNPLRAGQCIEAKLVPEFAPRRLEDPRAMVENGAPPETLYVTEVDSLPDRLVLMDTPDVDSIDRQNWTVAENLRAAGDVLIAVVTGEKYKDDRVVEFFRKARASGRVVLPLMNKANPVDDFAVARAQLSEFCADVGLDAAPCFVIPHDFALVANVRGAQPIRSLDGATDLWDHLSSLDVAAIKRRVYRDTVRRFAEQAGQFLDRCAEVGGSMRSVADEFEGRAGAHAEKYDPAPGAEIGGLFHAFVQAKRGAVRRAIGSLSAAAAKGAGALAKTLVGAVRRRARLEPGEKERVDVEIRAAHEQVLTRITYDLATSYVESSRNLREPAAHLVQAGLEGLDHDAIAAAVARRTLRSESISDEFRRHAFRTIETWWNDHAGRRRALEALDTVLAVMPAAIAAPIGLYTAGIGVSEAVAVAGPVVEQFVARVIEYQFGDQMFDLLSPWKTEQQQNFKDALLEHLTGPCLARLREALEPFEGEAIAELRSWHDQCLKAL